jgi:predicted metal-dependent TIM-barrel fold hydrolase
MDFIDAHLDLTGCSAQDLHNMHWFGATGALVTLHRRRPFETTPEAIAWMTNVVDMAVRELSAAELQPSVAVAIPGPNRPRRWHGDLWPALERLVGRPGVAAIGPLSAPESRDDDTLERHLSLAAEFELPVLLVPDRARLWESTRDLLAAAARAGVPGRRVFISRCDFTSVRQVLDAGALAGLAVGPHQLRASEAADLALRYGPAWWPQLALCSSAVPGSHDVLALPKAVRALHRVELPEAGVRALARANTLRWLHGQAMV